LVLWGLAQFKLFYMMDRNYRIAVLGLSREGLDLLRFLNTLKIKPVGLDGRSAKDFSKAELKEITKRTSGLYLGNEHLDHFREFDLVFRSPGVSLVLPEIKQAKKRGVIFSSLTSLFFNLCPAKIVGITGTKGKSTTASLIYQLVKGNNAGRVYFGGNIGVPPLKWLPKLQKSDTVILELSSFQLEDLDKSPHIAVLLNIVPEHLDRHVTFKKYVDAKSNIFLHQAKNDFLISSDDYALTRKLSRKAPGKNYKYSIKKILARGVYLRGNDIVSRNIKTGKRDLIMVKSEIPLLGEHNLQNLMAAISAALLLGVSPTQIRKKIKGFRALKHRLELVGSFKGVNFINDSMATTPPATLAAIDAVSGEVVLIMGGVSKGEDINVLARNLDIPRIKGIVLIGKMADRLSCALDAYAKNVPHVFADNLETAVQKAYNCLGGRSGTVLLSPSFASFDMFKDAYDRGDQFKQLVKSFIGKRRKA